MIVRKMLSLIAVLFMLATAFSVSTTVMADPVFATTAVATNLGYVKTNELSNGQAVYKKGNYYISRDVDGHNGGAWKRAIGSAEKLASKTTRDGTYNADLTKRIGD